MQHFTPAQPRHWKMCPNLSGSSWGAAGMGSAGVRLRARAKSKGGFLYKWGIFFWMHIEGELLGCVFLFLQGNNSWAELLLLHPAPLNKVGLGTNLAHSQCCDETRHHFTRCDGLVCDGRSSWHPAGLMLSWSPCHSKWSLDKSHFLLAFPTNISLHFPLLQAGC